MNTAPLTETLLDIPLLQLHDSPFQPRKTYNQAKLLELAETMKPPHGRVLQPIIVRLPNQNPRPLLAGVDTFTDYETVFGHRRRRAAELAGLASIPAIVRTMSDEEVKRAQIIENLARDDVHPIEEAEGFQALMKDHGITAEHLIAQTGKSRSYIYSRLKLLQACPTVRKACLAGEIGSETALLIARLRHDKLQERALKAIEAKYLQLADGGKKSFRQIRDLLASLFTLELKAAIFPTEDAALVPSAGVCSTCPKLSGNAPEYGDLAEKREGPWHGHFSAGNPRLCTDPSCWETKHKAHLQREAARLRAEGKTVVDGNKAKAALSAHGEVKGAYIALKDVKAELKKMITPAATVLIQDQRTGKAVEAVPAASLRAAGVQPQEKAAPKRSSYDSVAEEAKREAEAKARWNLFTAIRAEQRQRPRDLLELRFLAYLLLDRADYRAEERLEELWPNQDFENLGNLGADDLAQLVMDCMMLSGGWIDGYEYNEPRRLVLMAEHFGIDIEAARRGADAPAGPLSTPSEAARAPGVAAAKAKAGRARYSNAATGEAWSGRGLMPAWLRAALNKGQTLADFEQPTPSGAADGAAADAAPGGEGKANIVFSSGHVDFLENEPNSRRFTAIQMDGGAGSADAEHATAAAPNPAEAQHGQA